MGEPCLTAQKAAAAAGIKKLNKHKNHVDIRKENVLQETKDKTN